MREKLNSITVMAWIECAIVTGLGLAVVGSPSRYWFLLLLLLPAAVTNALPYQLSGSKVVLDGTVLTVRWLRSRRFHYSFNVADIVSSTVVPHDGPAGTRDSFHPESGLLELVRGSGPLVSITFSPPQKIAYAGPGLRLWGNPRVTTVEVRSILLAVDEPSALVEALADRLRPERGSDGVEGDRSK